MQIFDYRDYKAYLNDSLKVRGERSRMAEALRCHIAYISQVLKGRAHFSLEQADMLNRHLGHGEHESEFLLILVSFARAGTRSLREHYSRKIDKALEQRDVLKNRLAFGKMLPSTAQSIYYSSWYYAAIHILLTVPEFRTRERIAGHLGLSRTKVTGVLDFLIETGLAKRTRAGYEAVTTSVHLGNDSTMIGRHHTNWRLQAIAALDREGASDLHYSSVVTIDSDDVPLIRKELVAAIERVRKIVKASPEKRLYCYALDLFEVAPNP